MMPIAIHSQQEPLICTLTQQGSLAVAQVVLSLLLSLLIYTICVWEAVNTYMKCHAYVLDNHWYLSKATLPHVFNRLKDTVPLLVTHSIIKSLAIMFSKFFISFTHIDTCSITTTVLFAPCSCFCYLKYAPSEHKQNQSTHHDISPYIYIPALLPPLLVVLALAFVHVA